MDIDIANIIDELGISRVAGACGVSPSAVHRWKTRGRLPRTDYTGETAYSAVIAELHGRVTCAQLLKRSEAA